MNINSLLPPVNTTKLNYPKRSDVAVAGSETNKDAPKAVYERQQRKKHRGKDRRQRNLKPLLDSRSGSDRRKHPIRGSINLSV